MKIREIKEKIRNLEKTRDNAQKLQDLCLSSDPKFRSAAKQIAEDAEILDLRTFFTECIRLADGEIRRLETAIDETEIRV